MSRFSKSASRLEGNPAERLIVRSSPPLDFENQSRLLDEKLQQEHSVDLVASSLEAHWSSSPIKRDAPSSVFNFPVLGPTTQSEPEHNANRFEESLQPEALSELLPETKEHSDQESKPPPPGENREEDNSRTLTYPALPWGQRTRTRKAGSSSMRLITSLIKTADKPDTTKHQKPGQKTRSLRVQQKDDQRQAKRLQSGSTTSNEGSSRFKSSAMTAEPEAPLDDAVSKVTKQASQTSALENVVRHGRLQRKSSTSSDDGSYDPSEDAGWSPRPMRAQQRPGSGASGKQEQPSRTLRKKADTTYSPSSDSGTSTNEHGSNLQSHPHRTGSEWFECVLIPRWERGPEKSRTEHPTQEHSPSPETAGPSDVPQLPRMGKAYSKRSRRIGSKSLPLDTIDTPMGRASEGTAGSSSSSSKKSVVSTPPAKPTTSSPAKVFHGWWIQAKPCREKVSGCDEWIGVHGNVVDPKAMMWHTSLIKEAIDPTTVMTLTGSLYHLRGSIDEERMRSNGFPQDVVEAFRDGFPTDWSNILKDHFNGVSPSQHSSSNGQELCSPSKDGPSKKSQMSHVDPIDQTEPPKPLWDLPTEVIPSPSKRKHLKEAGSEAALESLFGKVKRLRTRAEENKKEPPTQQHRSSLTESTHMPNTTTLAVRKDHVLPAETLRVAKLPPEAPLVENHIKDDAVVVDLASSSAPQVHTRKAPFSLNLSVHGAKLNSLLANDRPSSLSPTLQLCTKVVMEQLIHSTQESPPTKDPDPESAITSNCSGDVKPKREAQEQESVTEQALGDLPHADHDSTACAPAQVGMSLGPEYEPSIGDTPTLSTYRNEGPMIDSFEEPGLYESTTALLDDENWPETTMRHLQKDRHVQEFNTSEDEENEAMFAAPATAPSTRDSYSGSITGVRAESHPPSSLFKSLSSISATSQSTVLDFVDRPAAIVGPKPLSEAVSESLVAGALANRDPEGTSTSNVSLGFATLHSNNALGANSIGSLGIFGSDLAMPIVPVSKESRATTTSTMITTDASPKDHFFTSKAHRSTPESPGATLDVDTTEQQESALSLHQEVGAGATASLQAGYRASGFDTHQALPGETETHPGALANQIGTLAKDEVAGVTEGALTMGAKPAGDFLHSSEQDNDILTPHAEGADVAAELAVKSTSEETVQVERLDSDCVKDVVSSAKVIMASATQPSSTNVATSHSLPRKAAGAGQFVSVKDLQAKLRFKNQRYHRPLKE
ncbi:hypothetical protein KVV02_005989 [Mortierella alpina]|uniref:SANTA domain-containing protein n=1 Tax=Mortierella alpina TaxID=64518 RepID=A0A9P8D2R1_MORAP|nr:hypothetical protein KVV02_005989 [Mortierella alpina]